MIITKEVLYELTSEAKESSRLRMNMNFHKSLDEKCHRFLNAVEPGTVIQIHRYLTKAETFVVLRGKVRIMTHDDDGSILDSVILCPEEGRYGVN